MVSADGRFGLRLVDIVSTKASRAAELNHEIYFYDAGFFALPAHGEAISGGSRSSLLTVDYLLQIVGSFFLIICVLLAVLAIEKVQCRRAS